MKKLTCTCASPPPPHNSHCEMAGYSAHTQIEMKIQVELPQEGAPWVVHRVENDRYLVVVVDTSLAKVKYPNQNVMVEKQT
jgi:hypothetical protein